MNGLLRYLKIMIMGFGLTSLLVASALAAKTSGAVVFQVNQDQVVFDDATIQCISLIPQKNTAESYSVIVEFKKEAADKIGAITSSNIGKQAFIKLDGKVLSSSTIQAKLGGKLQIVLTKEQANHFIESLGNACQTTVSTGQN